MDPDRFLFDPIYFGQVTKMRLLEAINAFREWRKFKVKPTTVSGYDRELRNLCLFLGNPLVADVKIEHLLRYLNGVVEMGWDRNGLLGRCMAFRKFFEYLTLTGHKTISPDLIPIPRTEFRIPRVIDEDCYKKLVSSIPKQSKDSRHIRNLAIVNLLWDTGARIGEVMTLNVEDLDLVNKKALIRTEKSRGKRPMRHVFWSEETNENLKSWLYRRERLAKRLVFTESDALFISVTSIQSGRRFTIKGAGEMLRRYSNRAEIPYVNAHSFRHKLGHRIIENGGSAADVMNILGHASVQSSSVYMMMRGDELESRYRLLEKAEHSNKKK
jgi:integrase/recombinase XerC